MINRAKGVINITNELKQMTITFVTFIQLVRRLAVSYDRYHE